MNSVLAVLAAAVVGAAATAPGGTVVGIGLGVVTLGVSGLSIWLRGYLVPGTPTLTKRYMPRWMLAWFGKAPRASPDGEAPPGTLDGEAVESWLLDAEILVPDADGEDLRFSDWFRERWERALEDGDVEAADALSVLGFEPVEAELLTHDEAVVVRREGTRVGKWPSGEALRADVASEAVLSASVPDWESVAPSERGQLLRGIRLFVGRCPNGESAALRAETVESCCSTAEVATVVCEESEQRLFEQATAEG